METTSKTLKIEKVISKINFYVKETHAGLMKKWRWRAVNVPKILIWNSSRGADWKLSLLKLNSMRRSRVVGTQSVNFCHKVKKSFSSEGFEILHFCWVVYSKQIITKVQTVQFHHQVGKSIQSVRYETSQFNSILYFWQIVTVYELPIWTQFHDIRVQR